MTKIISHFNVIMRHHKMIISVFCFVYTIQLSAQQYGMINGKVVEKNRSVEFANVALLSSKDSLTIVKSATTDSLGYFSFSNLLMDSYILKIQMIGFQPFRITLKLDSINTVNDLKNIELTGDSKFLQSVEITSHKDLIKKTTQGFIINAADNISQIGGTATDLLRNTPTVVVDAEGGGITIRGKSPLILINGRNSSLSSTDRIPASSIESIEIINNPSSQYDADAEGGIINIKLKKNTNQGTNGSVALGTGYGAKGRANSSFMINHQRGKWNVGLAYDNRFAGRTRSAKSNRINFDLPTDYYLTQNRFDNRYEQTQNLKFNIDFNPNDKNSFSFEVIGNIDGQDNNETLISQVETQGSIFNSKNSRNSIELGREKVGELAFNYSRKFNDQRKTLAINVSSSFNYETENTNITTQSLNINDNNLGDSYLQQTSNYQNSNVSNFKIDYTHPIAKKGTLETGYKAITRFTNADFKNLSFQNNEYIINKNASSIFDFQEQVHAAYLQYKNYVGKVDSIKWKYDIGIRAEQVYNNGKVIGNALEFNRNYFNFFPTSNVAYFINPSDFFKLSFTRRINRPGLGQLNPFIDITDSLNPHGGNPNLKPELVNALEMGYNKEWKKVSLSANIFYRYSTNIIHKYITLLNNGVALTQPANFGNATTYGFEGIVSIYPTKFWSLNTSVSLFQQHIDGSNISADVANDVLSWYGKVINNITLWKNSKLQLIGNYNSPIATPQGTKISIYNIDLGFQQKIFKNKGALGLVMTDVFNTQQSGLTAQASSFSYSRTFKIDTRALLITFAYSFGIKFKEELLENKFSND